MYSCPNREARRFHLVTHSHELWMATHNLPILTLHKATSQLQTKLSCSLYCGHALFFVVSSVRLTVSVELAWLWSWSIISGYPKLRAVDPLSTIQFWNLWYWHYIKPLANFEQSSAARCTVVLLFFFSCVFCQFDCECGVNMTLVVGYHFRVYKYRDNLA